ncbi:MULTISPECIES: amine dehydrogenase large subunit [Acetobacter]|uniref:Amine dehydrogenase n=4 Tax=Acetobacter TaxID=434 RepID=A0AAN1UA40_9PROT|nr:MULTISPECIES: amine dehydrogenase large subunit [Acetobacter]ASL39440.1 amine dehydrogenase [Acetobacter oryzifermentans]AXN01566.1 amine dehydrogenase [Acetobacter pomorum]KAA8394982.1 amine dehydrogenase [Acetobacter sp. DmW_125128]KAA8398716.1 amine dehydrogenase [Acetobacter sp. DmW_125127]KAA8399256.1 amine dehydrogenase [Acetobacter sp. DmW_125124]
MSLQKVRPSLLRALLGSAAILTMGGTAAKAAEPVLQTEQSDVITLPAYSPHTILVEDAVYTHNKDGRVYVVDADSGKLLGMVQAAYNANMALTPDAKRIYVAETTWERGNRGARNDLLAEYDANTLKITSDEKLPARALVTPKKNDFALNADGSRSYVYQMSPSNAVEVVDNAAHKVTQTVEIPGCALVYPWGNAGFSSLCADGTLANVSLGADGKVGMTHTAPFFEPDKDGIFEQSPTVAADGTAYFLSYSGMVYPTKMGENSTVEKPWSLQEGAGMKAAPDSSKPFEVTWRPGGWQIAALHKASHQMYVLMHKGTFWTHKDNGTEVWVFDTQTHKRIRRYPLKVASNLVGVTQDAHPLMFTANEDNGDFFVSDALTGKPLRTIKALGTSLIFTVAPGEG